MGLLGLAHLGYDVSVGLVILDMRRLFSLRLERKVCWKERLCLANSELFLRELGKVERIFKDSLIVGFLGNVLHGFAI